MELPIDGGRLAAIAARRGWSHAQLDRWRGDGDPTADTAIRQLLARYGVAPSRAAIDIIHRELPTNFASLPDFEVKLPSDLDGDKVQIAERLFEVYGAQILMVLGLYALPGAFAASRGVEVLAATGEIGGRSSPTGAPGAPHPDPLRRVWETERFVVAMLRPKGLRTNDVRVLRSVRAVRLFHALTRARLVDDEGDLRHQWLAAERRFGQGLGVPVNQEDKAGNLMEFAVVVIEGLHELGIELTAEQEEGYLYTWGVIGRLLGVDQRLIPSNLEEGIALTTIIRERQVGKPWPSETGRRLATSLLAAYNAHAPWFAPTVAEAFMRRFLSRDRFCPPGSRPIDIAALLGIPRRFTPMSTWNWMLVNGVRVFSDLMDKWADWTGPSDPLVRRVSRLLMRAIESRDPNHAQPSFMVADRVPERPAAVAGPAEPLTVQVPKLEGPRLETARRWRREVRAQRRRARSAKR